MSPVLGIIGGTGFYRLLDDVEETIVETPYGWPSAPIAIGRIGERDVAFLPRHGKNHDFLPTDVPYSANLAALKQLGISRVLGFNTVGSLQKPYRKGDFVVTSQFVDRTRKRTDTIFTSDDAAHISSAFPYCEEMRAIAIEALAEVGVPFHREGTVVVIEGPRFSTAAESRWFRDQGWHTVNMTQYPEVVLARELELSYANISYITDYDVAASEVTAGEVARPVTHKGVLEAFAAGSPVIMNVIRAVVDRIDPDAVYVSDHLEEARV